MHIYVPMHFGLAFHLMRVVIDNTFYVQVVFVGDSITEQRQGTSLNMPRDDLTGIKEVFDKTFTKDKGGDFNGIAMGISGDTVCFYL